MVRSLLPDFLLAVVRVREHATWMMQAESEIKVYRSLVPPVLAFLITESR